MIRASKKRKQVGGQPATTATTTSTVHPAPVSPQFDLDDVSHEQKLEKVVHNQRALYKLLQLLCNEVRQLGLKFAWSKALVWETVKVNVV